MTFGCVCVLHLQVRFAICLLFRDVEEYPIILPKDENELHKYTIPNNEKNKEKEPN